LYKKTLNHRLSVFALINNGELARAVPGQFPLGGSRGLPLAIRTAHGAREQGLGCRHHTNCNMGKFKDRKTKKLFYAFNAHFDHKGKIARNESAKLLLRKIKEIAGSFPSVVTDDLNARPQMNPYR
jgi:hypothetical protein